MSMGFSVMRSFQPISRRSRQLTSLHYLRSPDDFVDTMPLRVMYFVNTSLSPKGSRTSYHWRPSRSKAAMP